MLGGSATGGAASSCSDEETEVAAGNTQVMAHQKDAEGGREREQMHERGWGGVRERAACVWACGEEEEVWIRREEALWRLDIWMGFVFE